MQNEYFGTFVKLRLAIISLVISIRNAIEYFIRPLGRPRRRWEDNIKMDLYEVRGVCGDRMKLTQDKDKWQALVSAVKKFLVP
jgi:hypothetical protein